MKTFQLDCGNCRVRFSLPMPEAFVQARCPHCGAETIVQAFPALLREVATEPRGETLAVEEESSCFYHPQKKASVVCEGCGRFLCSLCDIELERKHMCSTCIESGVRKGRLDRLKSETTRYDDIALSLAIVPMIFIWVTMFTAPVALFIAVRNWKKPMGIIPRTRWRFVVAILVAGLQLAGWGFLGLSLVMRLSA